MSAPSSTHLPAGDEATEEILLVRQATRDLLASLYPDLPGDDWAQSWPSGWKTLQDHGLWSTIEPPDGSLAMALVVAEELGRALYPGPAYEALAAALVVSRLNDNTWDLDTDAAPVAAFVCSTADGCVDPVVEVPPETLLIVACGDVISALPAEQAERAATPSTDLTRRLVSMRFTTTPPPATGAPAGTASDGRAARSLLYCADTLGCVQHVLDKTTEYAKQRTTFGSPIGKYQAVAHRLVDHAVTTRQMRYLIGAAAQAFDSRAEDRHLQLAIAETFLWGRGMAIISDCIQLCGGIGFTWEWGHHFYQRRVIQNTTLGSGTGRPHARLASGAHW